VRRAFLLSNRFPIVLHFLPVAKFSIDRHADLQQNGESNPYFWHLDDEAIEATLVI
jgi:hypothetical protein